MHRPRAIRPINPPTWSKLFYYRTQRKNKQMIFTHKNKYWMSSKYFYWQEQIQLPIFCSSWFTMSASIQKSKKKLGLIAENWSAMRISQQITWNRPNISMQSWKKQVEFMGQQTFCCWDKLRKISISGIFQFSKIPILTLWQWQLIIHKITTKNQQNSDLKDGLMVNALI